MSDRWLDRSLGHLARLEAPLDDLGRARLEASLDRALDDVGAAAPRPAAGGAARRRRRRWLTVAAIGVATVTLGAAAAAVLELGRAAPPRPAPASPGAAPEEGGGPGRGRSPAVGAPGEAPGALPATAPDELPATAPDELPATAPAARAPDARRAPAPGAPAARAPAPGATPGGDVETAAALFERAERALAAGDRDGARAALRRLLDRFAGEPLADDARYQLARLARHDPPAALAYLDAIRSPSLAEPAAFLRCAIKADAGHADAATCLEAFRQAHPRSAHGDDALLRLAELHFRRGDCAGATPLLADFLRRHPGHAQARARLARCQDPRPAR